MNGIDQKYTLEDCRILDLSSIKNEKGKNTFLPSSDEIGFEIKRVYYLYNLSPSSIRGEHAHKYLKQIIVSVTGSFLVRLQDENDKKVFRLDSGQEGLYIPAGIWRSLYGFSEGAVCLVFASDCYKEEDYVRDFEKFTHFRLTKIVPFDQGFLGLLRVWSKDPEIRRFHFTGDISKGHQINSYNTLSQGERYLTWGLCYNNEKIGFLALKVIKDDSAVGEAVIGEKRYWNKGIGEFMLDFLKGRARILGLDFLYMKALPENIQAIKCYEKSGFKLVDEKVYKTYCFQLND